MTHKIMKLGLVLIQLWQIVSLSVAIADVKDPLFLPETEQLPNGLKIVWFLNRQFPVLDLVLLTNVGLRDDPPGKSGVAHLLSQSLDRGAAGLSAQKMASSVESLGATQYKAVEEDGFTVGVHGLSADSETLLKFLYQVTTQADLLPTEVKREQKKIQDTWEHIGDLGQTLADLAYRRILAAGTPYGRGGLLSIKEFKTITPEDVSQFYKRTFTPSNSTLMVVGQVEQSSFRQKILNLFGTWKGNPFSRSQNSFKDPRLSKVLAQVPMQSSRSGLGARSTPSSTRSARQVPGKIVVVDRPGLNQAQVRLGFRGPLINSPDHYALVVGNAILGQSFNSRLNSQIRDKMGLTYGISSDLSYSRDLGIFTISSSVRNESVGQLIQKTFEILDQFKKEPPSAAEVDAAKSYLMGGFPLSVSTIQAQASRWLAGRMVGASPTYLAEYVAKIGAVKPEEVQAAIIKNFQLDQMITVIAGDAQSIEKNLKENHLALTKRLTVSDLN